MAASVTHPPIIPRDPGFAVKWAIPAFSLIFCVVIAATWMVRYPEIVKARGALGVAEAGPRLYGTINIPQKDLGRVAAGMSVQLHIDGYPYGEYGFVPATILQVSSTATEQGYAATVELPAGLHTSRDRVIPFRRGLKTDAIVIIQNLRLLQRLLNGSLKRIDH